MIVLIPLGGTGQRFKRQGYTEPKALINVFGKPILYWLLDHLTLEQVEEVYIPYNQEYIPYRLEDRLRRDYPLVKFSFVELPRDTRGAAETVNIALKAINRACRRDAPILLLDGDNFYTTDVIGLWKGENRLIVFRDRGTNPIYSYTRLLEDGRIEQIAEKSRISDHACTGAYGFRSHRELLAYTQTVLDLEITEKGEFYTSVVVQRMIECGHRFDAAVIDEQDWHCLGTPIQVKQFCDKNLPP
jgi:NDP-sugar pyrophosphorylase family protein